MTLGQAAQTDFYRAMRRGEIATNIAKLPELLQQAVIRSIELIVQPAASRRRGQARIWVRRLLGQR